MKTDLHSIIIDRKFNSRFKLLIEKLSANFWSLSFIIMQKEFDLTQSFYLSLSFVKWSVIWSISPTCLRADFTSPDPKSAKNSQVISFFCIFGILVRKSRLLNVDEIDTCDPFHQHFACIFFCTKVLCAAFL